MWNWSDWKSIVLGVTTVFLLQLAGIQVRGAIIIGIAFAVFARWVISEINFIRTSHGTDIEELENKIDELKRKLHK